MYSIHNVGGVMSYPETEMLDVHHRWRFETRIASGEEELKLDWLVVDVDDFMKTNHPSPEDR